MGVGQVYKLLKLTGTGVVALVLGVVQVASGESQGIVAGIGSLVAAGVVFAFIGWVVFRKEKPPAEDGRPADERRRGRLLWLGVLLTLAPGLLYLYLRYSMPDFKMAAVVFLGVPVLVAGLGCLAAGVWYPRRQPVAVERGGVSDPMGD